MGNVAERANSGAAKVVLYNILLLLRRTRRFLSARRLGASGRFAFRTCKHRVCKHNANTMWRKFLYSGFQTPKAVTYHELVM